MISEEDRSRMMEADRLLRELIPNAGTQSISHVTAMVNSRRLHLLKRFSEITLTVGLGGSRAREQVRVGDHPLIQNIFRCRDNVDRIPDDNYTAKNVAIAILQKAIEAAAREVGVMSAEIQAAKEHAEKQDMEREKLTKGRDMPTLANIMARMTAPANATDS